MPKTAAERLIELAELLSQKAEEIRTKTEGVEARVNTTTYKRVSKQSKK
ncbi:hypothetical protein [Sporosarcina sp. 6E9]|nr:hypothetical protein [Sporosarcina sp. 6E9]MBO1909657.1 hypothetical protein [Microvirga sp. 3-52]